ncbi:MAG: hypothetical protein ACLSDO_04180 [Anaerotruncus colihominis]
MIATQPMMSFGMTMATCRRYGAGNVPRIRRRAAIAMMSVSFSM